MSGLENANILLTGGRGMVGSALTRALRKAGNQSILSPTRAELDLCNQAAVESYIGEARPDIIIIAAAKVGGIYANSTYPADFLYDNLAIAAHTIHAAYKAGVKRLLFLGSSCIYPREAPQPIPEDSLLSGPLEQTNEPYAVAKIAGLKLCQAYREQYGVLYHSAMPTNLYGPGDNYHPENSHVIPGLIRRFHEAKENGAPEVEVWGTGKVLREFLHVEDLAAACLHVLSLADPPDWINIGSGIDQSIGDLAQAVKEAVGYEGKLTFDTSKPDGTPRKLLDSTRIQDSGWNPAISLQDGLKTTYNNFLEASEGQTV
ncbi:GDP-L-fucose synthase [bacterium]|jgi:GDP-L-fucose synthase|nr:GDP-L-fucose synthase [Verrucomicrobiales bacterium]MDC3255208.1 GDP-L-fucose synthase [bacterium]MDF1789074.1 GDP-L-fucose synthase [Verrucomicrobiales bacterium]